MTDYYEYSISGYPTIQVEEEPPPPECVEGTSRCMYGVSQVCQGGEWVEGGTACEDGGTDDGLLVLAGVGVAAVAGLLLFSGVFKGKK